MKKLITSSILILIGLIGPASARASITFVQSTSTPQVGGFSQKTLPSISTTAGDLLVSCVTTQKSPTTVTMEDSQGGTWTLATTSTVGTGPVNTSVFYRANITGGSLIASSTESGVSAQSRLIVHEYAGAALTSPLDSFVASTTPVANALVNSGLLTTVGQEELLFQCSATNGVGGFSASRNGFTGRETSGRSFTQDQIVASTTPTGFLSLTTNGNWNTIMAAFLPVQSVTPASPTAFFDIEIGTIINGLLNIQ